MMHSPVNAQVKLPSIKSLLQDVPRQSPVQSPNAGTSSLFDFRPPSAPEATYHRPKQSSDNVEEQSAPPHSQGVPGTGGSESTASSSTAIRRHRNARACDECRHRSSRRKIRCSKAAADTNEADHDGPCENCSKAGISCAFAHALEPNKVLRTEWQPPKSASASMTRKPMRNSFSRPSTSSSLLRPTSAATSFPWLPPPQTASHHQQNGYNMASTPSCDSLRRLSTTASSLSLLSTSSMGSPTSSLFAFAPPVEPALRVANFSNVLALTALQKTFLPFSREATSSDAASLHVAAASVQSPMGCGHDVAAQVIGAAMIGSAQTAGSDSDCLILFYYDHFRQGRIGSELLMAGCLKVGRLPPSAERDRRAISLSLIATWHSMAYASQRSLLPCPALDVETSLSLLQASAISPPSLQTLDVVKASLAVFGGPAQESIDSDRLQGGASETIKCLLKFRSLYYRMCFAGREQRLEPSDEDVLLLEAQKLLDMFVLLNQTVILIHSMALIATTLGVLQLHATFHGSSKVLLSVRRIAQELLQSPYAAGGLHGLQSRIHDFVRLAVLEPSTQSKPAAVAAYLSTWLAKGYLGFIELTLLQQPPPPSTGNRDALKEGTPRSSPALSQ